MDLCGDEDLTKHKEYIPHRHSRTRTRFLLSDDVERYVL